jgi:hypothetical protein
VNLHNRSVSPKASISLDKPNQNIINKRKELLGYRETDWYKSISFNREMLFFQNGANSVFRFNFSQEKWSIALQSNVTLPSYFRATELPDNSYLITGGELKGKTISTCSHYSGRVFLPRSDMIIPRKAHTACYHNGYVYVFGGFTVDNSITNLCERFDLCNNVWVKLPPMKYPKAYCTATALGAYIYLVGGFCDTRIDGVSLSSNAVVLRTEND